MASLTNLSKVLPISPTVNSVEKNRKVGKIKQEKNKHQKKLIKNKGTKDVKFDDFA